MTLPSLAGAPWLADPAAQRLLALLSTDGGAARVVGGAVRDTLLGRPVEEVDVATTVPPERVTALARAAGAAVIPTGIEHGTVTVVVDGQPFEVTTLREDVETDGRRAKVAFGDDWEADARRRDFTMNALSVDAAGTLYDPVGGYADCLARRVRFIGDPEARIREDHLRILRFFRFQARFGTAPPDPAAIRAVERMRLGILALSAERVGQEMRKLVVAPAAPAVVAVMAETGILGLVLGGVARLGRFARHAALPRATPPDAAPALAALGAWLEEDVVRIAGRLKLSNAERRRMSRAVEAAAAIEAVGESAEDVRRADRVLVWRLGHEAWRDGMRLAWADAGEGADAGWWTDRLSLADRFAPALPVAGRDLLAAGLAPGPEVGRRLAELEARWIASDFSLGRDALLAELRRD